MANDDDGVFTLVNVFVSIMIHQLVLVKCRRQIPIIKKNAQVTDMFANLHW